MMGARKCRSKLDAPPAPTELLLETGSERRTFGGLAITGHLWSSALACLTLSLFEDLPRFWDVDVGFAPLLGEQMQ